MFGIGEWLAENWTPGNVIFDQWASFVDISLVLLLLVVIAVFLFYRLSYYNSLKIRRWQDVFKLRHPWIKCLVAVPLMQVLLGLASSFVLLSNYSSAAFLGTLTLVVLEGVVGLIGYWILSRFFYPARGKYFPAISNY